MFNINRSAPQLILLISKILIFLDKDFLNIINFFKENLEYFTIKYIILIENLGIEVQ